MQDDDVPGDGVPGPGGRRALAGLRPDAKVLAAPDKFRGSLSAEAAASAIADGVRDALPLAAVIEAPIADGGEGSVAACLRAGFDEVTVGTVTPLGEAIIARYARRDNVAVVELAEASGLRLAGRNRHVALWGSTEGTGRLVRHALRSGAHTIVLAVGGSATTDGGTGLAHALGVRFLDSDGQTVPAGGATLARIARVDVTGLDAAVRPAAIVVATDVSSPLVGPSGAAYVYARQKGALDGDIEDLDGGLRRLATVLERASGIGTASLPGAGAAGGVGASAVALLGARIESGAGYLMELVGIEAKMREADLVITGEGSLDTQTLTGKAPAALARMARSLEKPVLAVAGRISLTAAELRAIGIRACCSIEELEPDPAGQFRDASPLLRRAARTAVERFARDADKHARGG